jgi:hypothetical protein
MPEKSGMDAALRAPIVAGTPAGAACCPEAGVTAAANVATKSKCRFTFMADLPFMASLSLLRPRPGADAVNNIPKSGTVHDQATPSTSRRQS